MNEQRAHDAENRRRRSNAEREGDQRDRSPRFLARHRAHRERDVRAKISQPLVALHVLLPMTCGGEQPRFGFFQGAESANGFVIRDVRVGTPSHELLGAEREMEFDLVLHFALPPVAPTKREVKPAANARTNHGPSPPGLPSSDRPRALGASERWTRRLRQGTGRRWPQRTTPYRDARRRTAAVR